MATLTGGATALNFDAINLGKLLYGLVTVSDAGRIRFTFSDGSADELTGVGFTYSTGGALTGGTVTGAVETLNGAPVFAISGFSVAATDFVNFVNAGDNAGLLTAVFSGADTLTGTAGNDVLRGYAGNDVFVASGGVDVIDGGSGTNTLRLNGSYAVYTTTTQGAGAWTLVDSRPTGSDGRITATGVQVLQFADSTLTAANAPSLNTVNALEAAFANTGRVPVLSTLAQTPTIALADGTSVPNPSYTQRVGLLDLAARADLTATGLVSAYGVVGHYFDATTAVATLSYEFFTGKTPTSAGYDFLVNSTTNANNLNSAYYARFTEENRYINFAVNLGKVGEGKAAFTAAYGALSLSDSVKKAYLEVFGFAADDAKVAAILTAGTGIAATPTRADYFAYYGGDGANGIGTKAAMVGFLMVEAVKADLGTYALANDSFMVALAGGAGQYNVDLKAVYAPHSAPLVGAAADGHHTL